MRSCLLGIVVLSLLAGCEGSGTLVVQVRSDLLPVRQLSGVRVTGERVGGAALPESGLLADGSRAWDRGVRVAEIAGLEPGTYRLTVSAVDASGAVIVARPVRTEITSGVTVVTVLLTQDCAGVACPSAAGDPLATACLAGRCVPAECIEEASEDCGAAECTTAAMCDAPRSACARAECSDSGGCFTALDHESCGAEQVCDGNLGCIDPGVVGPATLLTNTGMAVREDGFGFIDPSRLEAVAPATPPTGVEYTVAADPIFGRLEVDMEPCPAPCVFTQADIIARRLVYKHGGGEDPADSFEFTLRVGELVSEEHTFDITVVPVNDPPVHTFTTPLETAIDTEYAFRGFETEDVLRIDDADVGAGELELQIDVSPGVGRLLTTDGLTVTAGALDSASVTVRGTLAALNTALSDFRAEPDRLYAGPLMLTLTTNDLGNTGMGGPGITTDSITIDVSAEVPRARDDVEDYASVLSVFNPVGWFRLAEMAGGTAADSVATPNDGSYVDGPALGQAGALFSGDPAVGFDGRDGRVVIPHSARYENVEGSIVLWFRATSLARSQTFFSKNAGGLGAGEVHIGLTGGGLVEAELESAVAIGHVTSTDTISVGRWYHLVLTFGPAGLHLYLDGALAAPPDAFTGGMGANREPIVLGAGTDLAIAGTGLPLNNHFVGQLDEVALFGYAMDLGEVRALHGSGPRRYELPESTSLDVPPHLGVLLNDWDRQGDGLTAELIVPPRFADAFILRPDGGFDYTPRAGYVGSDDFIYRASDGTHRSNLGSVSIFVTPVP